jgi:hypothetical protein
MTAVRELIASHEMLQMRLHDGQYVASPLAGQQGEQFVRVYEVDEASAVSYEDIMEKLSVEMRPEPKASLRVALIHRGNELSEFLLLAHKAIADGRSVIRLCEDVYRLYEQLSNKKKLSLKPTQKTYKAMIAELAANNRELAKERLADAQVKNNLTSIEIVVAALLGLLAQSDDQLHVDCHADYRLVDEKLKDTVAALTVTRHVPEEILREADSSARITRIAGFLKALTADHGPVKSSVLLNLECFVQEPWLGGRYYVPQGFIATNGKPREPYLLEITPLLTSNGVRLHLKHEPDAAALAQKIAGGFEQAFESILKDNERVLKQLRSRTATHE